MICKLCKKEKVLIKKSHILPNFIYKNHVFDSKNRMIMFDLKSKTDKVVQSGLYEKNLLCADCDNSIIGKYERYASHILYGKNIQLKKEKIIKLKNKNNVKYFQLEEINYNKFKLFLLSLIWRSSIAKLDNFKQVNLGPYEEEIRLMLYTEDTKKWTTFPVFMFIISDEYKHVNNIICTPMKFKFFDFIIIF